MSSGIQQTNIEQLAALQRIEDQFDIIINTKGSLPSSIEKLESDIMQVNAKKTEAKENVDELDRVILDIRDSIKYLESQIGKYEEQLKATKNDREYDAISEDIEVQKIEVKLLKRKIPQKLQNIKEEKEKIEQHDKEIFIKENSLIAKKERLHQIHEKTKEKEVVLEQEREKVVPKIEKEVYDLYQRIRTSKLDAAVDVINNACSGCFIVVPSQRQLEIRLQKVLYTCENCGRILLNVHKPIIDEEKPKRKVRRGRAAATR